MARATPVPVATPVPKKRTFFERLFGRRTTPPPAKATPAPTPIPAQKVRKTRTVPTTKTAPTATKTAPTATKPKAPAEPSAPVKTAPTKTPAPAPEKPAPPAVEPTEKPAPPPAPPKTTVKKTPGKSTAKTPAGPAPDGSDPEVLDKQKYDTAKARAMEDAEIQALKKTADNAVSDDEANKAQRAYNRALFAKMRKIEPGIKERIDRMEAAMMKRLGDK